MNSKVWFAALKYIVPTEMEYFLEEEAAEGWQLKPVGEMGLFYFEFVEAKPSKCRYVVDVTALPKHLYMQTLSEKEWEYMGNSGNCHIWRKTYEETRPKDFADRICRKNHCKRLGIAMLIFMVLCLAAALALIWGYMYEGKMQAEGPRHVIYLVEAALQVPFILYFGWAAGKLLSR